MSRFALAALLLVHLQQPQTPISETSIEGVVLRADTNEPLAKAEITAVGRGGPIGFPGTPPPVWSDAQGRFKVRIPGPGSYTIFAARNGFARQQYGERAPRRGGTALTVVAGQTIKDIVFRMIPAGVVSGRISDSSGEPLPVILVTLMRATYNADGKRTLEEVGEVPTDDRGDYRIPLVTPGRYFVKAVPPTISPTQADDIGNQVIEPGYVQTYYPGTSDSSQAGSVEIRAGTEAGGIDFRLIRQDLFRIRGRVIDSGTGKPPLNTFISVFPRDPDVTWESGSSSPNYNSADGSFELKDIVPGAYWVRATMTDGSIFNIKGSARVAVDVTKSDVENAVLTLSSGFSLQGRIGFDGPPPARPSLEQISVLLHLTDPGRIGGDLRPVLSKSDGQFTVENVQPGNYRLRALYPCVTSARLAGEDLLRGALITGPVDEPIQVVLCSKRGLLLGSTLDGDQKHVSGAQVVLIPEQRYRWDLYRTATSDQEGRFTFNDIPPGDYKVFAWEDLETNAYYDADLLRKYEALGKPITIDESPSQTVEVKVIPAGM